MRICPVIVAIALAAACSSNKKSPAPAKPEAQPTATAAAPPSPSQSPSAIGDGMSEEAFKALHELRTDEPPPRRGQMIDLAGTKAYLSLPPGKTAPMPAVVVIHEWWGLNDNVKHWADRLAADGYAALAVDLYDGRVATTPDDAMATMKSVDDKRALGILQAGLDFLQADPRVKATKLGAIGWCFGGGWTLQLAINVAKLDAAVMYYGRVVTDPKALAVDTFKAKLLGIFGKQDQGIPAASVDEFERALGTAGVDHTILRYDADHAFANPSSARYDQEAASAAWAEASAFLAKHLK